MSFSNAMYFKIKKISNVISGVIISALLSCTNSAQELPKTELLLTNWNEYLVVDSLAMLLKQSSHSSKKFKVYYKKINGLAVTQGDIILDSISTVQKHKIKDTIGQQEMLGTAYEYRLWPNATVYYTINNSLRDNATIIKRAIERYNQVGFHFIEATGTTPANVKFTASNVYSEGSNIGRTGGLQNLYLTKYSSYGTVLHEIGHLLGLWHEHCRADRDQYITINFSNIPEREQSQFKMVVDNEATTLETPYDYNSIMHYNEYAFSSIGRSIQSKHGEKIGNRDSLSKTDITGLKKLYKLN